MKKGIAAAAAAVVCLRLAALAGADTALKSWLLEKAENGQLLTATLNIELGAVPVSASPGVDAAPETASPAEDMPDASTPAPTPLETAAPSVSAGNIRSTTIDGGLTIKNTTSAEVDISALMSEGLGLTLSSASPQILIVHTHGSEAYTPDGEDQYVDSGNSRTQDLNYNVIRVGDELAAGLEACGLTVLHDREIYDYPSYTGSYTRSGQAVEAYLAQYPGIAIVIDLHRDALGSGDVIYKTVAEVPGAPSSQLMLLVGNGETGLYHPNWRENLKLALFMQNAVCEKHPTLARPISLVPERYNQQLTTGSLILEVGSAGNTLQEALTAVRLFADAVGPRLAELLV